MRKLTQRLIAAERRLGEQANAEVPTGFRICEKLRRPLCTFAGVAGFRALLARALVLARVGAPMLNQVQITSGGAIQTYAQQETPPTLPDSERAAGLLADELLGLLLTFIGEALTLRLVHDVWPNAATDDPHPESKQL